MTGACLSSREVRVIVADIPCTEVCGCWVFTCNNKTSQVAINEECEDD